MVRGRALLPRQTRLVGLLMDTERMTKILLEVVNGVPAPAEESDEDRRMRATLTLHLAAVHAKGGRVDIPHELP
jgi:hypothetical protein